MAMRTSPRPAQLLTINWKICERHSQTAALDGTAQPPANSSGGIDVSTLYRGVHSGRYPRPVNVSNNVVRWLADECEAALVRMIAQRDEPKPVGAAWPTAPQRSSPNSSICEIRRQ